MNNPATDAGAVRAPARMQGANGPALDVERVRADFPILHQEVHGKPLAYLDNGASAQKPESVIEAVNHYYRHDHSNVHRGVHELSMRATDAYEGARERVRRFLNAASTREIIYVRGTTEAINLVAQAWGRPRLGAGDEILISELEHHSNIVPWQLLREQTGATLRVAPINDRGEVELEAFTRLLSPRTRMVALSHVSNALGTVLPVKRMIDAAHEAGAVVLLDGAQAVPHVTVDVRELGCDFYAFSGHKVYGPTGIGILYGREDLLESMEPWQGGGDMILRVTFEETRFNALPYRYEAGTPNIAGAVGLGAALDYVDALGLDAIGAHEHDLLAYATQAVDDIDGVRLVGTASDKAGILSFLIEGVHAHDVGTILDSEGIAVRAGHHCAMPVMDHFGVAATTRASIGLYNTREEIDRLAAGIHKVIKMLS